MDLYKLGWNNYFNDNFLKFNNGGYTVGRIFAEHKNIYKLYTEYGELLGEISGKFRYEILEHQDYPAVGDWVIITARPEEMGATIHKVLPRKSKFSRKVAGTLTQEQIVATNIDTIFIVSSLNHEFNIRRLERYLILAWESGTNPVIVLSKADLCSDIESKLQEVESIAPGIPVHPVSVISGEGVTELNKYICQGTTTALLGSSGVGKSSLINYLLGNTVQEVNEISKFEDKGRHTSTYRELFVLPKGGLIIDTPGMREIQLWDGSDGLYNSFEDIEELSRKCKFCDCSHTKEPGCAVKEAILEGSLNEDRFLSYKKLQKEISFLKEKQKIIERSINKKNSKNKLYASKNKSSFTID